MRWVLVLGLLSLTACESAASREERKLETLRRAGASKDELCTQGKKVAAAYLDAGEELKFQIAKASADSTCLSAQLDRNDR